MGLKLTINKEDNPLYFDFIDAYWKIENIIFSSIDGESYVEFLLNAYPSRESSKRNNMPIEHGGTIDIGGPENIAYKSTLRTWDATFRASDIFTTHIPINESEQKDVLYNFVKAYTGLPFVDVFEEDGGSV